MEQITKYIYALVDNNAQEIIYIGQTKHPRKRFSEHMCETRMRMRGGGPKKTDRMYTRLATMVASDNLPEMVILETTTLEQSMEREMWWLRTIEKLGRKLINRDRSGARRV